MVKKTKKATKTEATKALREMKLLFDTGKVVMTSSTSLASFLERWLEQTVPLSDKPVKSCATGLAQSTTIIPAGISFASAATSGIASRSTAKGTTSLFENALVVVVSSSFLGS